jgi:hypothetical protein
MLRPPSVALVRTAFTVLVIVVYGIASIGEPIESIVDELHTRVGLQAVSETDTVVDVMGARHSVIGRDSMTLLLMVDSRCELMRWSTLQGVASRLVVVNDSTSAVAFGRLAGDESAIMMAGYGLFVDRLRIFATPSSVLVDRHGIIRGRWLASVPRHLELLNLLVRLRS